MRITMAGDSVEDMLGRELAIIIKQENGRLERRIMELMQKRFAELQPRHRGPWKHGETYHLNDSVTHGGSMWIAIVETPQGKPGESSDWILAVRKGRDGKDGERGPMGPPRSEEYTSEHQSLRHL